MQVNSSSRMLSQRSPADAMTHDRDREPSEPATKPGRGRDLLVAQQTPRLGTGQAMRVYTVARALAASGDGLTFAYVRFEGDEPDAAFRAIPGIDFHEIRASRGAARALLYGSHRLRRTPAAWARGISPEICPAVAELGSKPSVRRVIADGPVIASALAPIARRSPVVYNAHNLESAFRHELEGSGLGSQRAARAAEHRLLARSAESWMVSERDMAGARELCPGATLRYVPNVVDTRAIHPVAGGRTQPRVLMVADYSYEPNQQAVRFLVDDVLPRAWAKRPDLTLTLVGRALVDPVPDEPRVVAKGFVPDLAAEYDASACAVVPLLQGGGTPFKFIEALAYGVPVVATPRAAAGLAVVAETDYLAGADAQGFADAILRLVAPDAGVTAQRLARNGRRIVEQRYSIDALVELVRP